MSIETIKSIAASPAFKKLNDKTDNDLNWWLEMLINHGEVEVGYRASCGKTDNTQKKYRQWLKVVKMLKKAGLVILEEPVKHKNSYATTKGGFWNSIIYKIGNTIGVPKEEYAGITLAEASTKLCAAAPDLLYALKAILGKYIGLVESGDAGFWDAEQELEVKKARLAIKKATE